jgi:hypothetical protein
MALLVKVPLLTHIGKPEKFNATEMAIALAEFEGRHLADMNAGEVQMLVNKMQHVLEAVVRQAAIT